jgi:hypothetical protein
LRDEPPHHEPQAPDLADVPSERPASRYFSQSVVPEAALVEPVIDSPAAPDAGSAALDDAPGARAERTPEDDGAEVAAPRRGRARTGDGAKATASRRKAATPRARDAQAATGADDAVGAAPAATVLPPSAAPDAEGAAPAKAPARPRSRARKPAAE